ncbi:MULTISPECIES: hypothetical protein [unclassified Actinopolyspora]|uniref:hypothetical protein n=1 Tax=unclassified Actinopolyspora TaxID=2639451 RepID=UPI001F610493|nr:MULTISPECIES: hypothetical protein [unclassified Actinopolyspora]
MACVQQWNTAPLRWMIGRLPVNVSSVTTVTGSWLSPSSSGARVVVTTTNTTIITSSAGSSLRARRR